jgi:hypothetical protein
MTGGKTYRLGVETCSLIAAACLTSAACGVAAGQANRYQFDEEMSRPVLEAYLSRAITMMDLLTGVGDPNDNIRMLKDMGAKFAGRTIYLWGGERHLPIKLARARQIAPKIHTLDPEMILQAGIFEIVTTEVTGLGVPDWVLREFHIAPQQRPFRYEAMVSPDGRFRDKWGKGASVPDITQLETKLFFFYLAAKYIDVGCEAIHFGQAALIGTHDPERAHWRDLLTRVRSYARAHARRHLVLCDAHTPSGGCVSADERLLFDFHSFPLRIDEVPDRPREGVLRVGYLDSFFGRSRGGVSPSGWRCEHLPYLVELDNFEPSDRPGENIGGHWCWGYDEISWFANQPAAYRNDWLRYAWDWVRRHDANGYLEMPGSRCLSGPAIGGDGKRTRWYFANRASPAVPTGFGQEDTIKAIWARGGPSSSRPSGASE